MNIVICFDRNYQDYCMPVVRSIRANTKQNINIYFIIDPIINNEKIKSYEKENIIVISKSTIELENLIFNDGFVNSLAMYYRFFISELLNIDKCIYLECDSIVNCDLKELWDIDLGDNYIAACKDMFGQTVKKSQLHQGMVKDNINLDYPSYMSGIMVMNLEKWRQDNIANKLTDFVIRNKVRDMIAINVICKDKILEIDKNYCFPASRVSKDQKHPMLEDYNIDDMKIVHWNGRCKPWNSSINKEYWEKYND